MAAEPYSVLRLDEIEAIPVAGVNWKPVRRTLGIDAFGINAYTADTGEHVVEEHTEESLGHQEVYVVIAGHATFTLDDEELDAPQGTIVFIRDPSVRRHATAAENGTTVLAVGGVPGIHSPSAWEWYFEAERYRESGDHASALRLLEEARDRFPDNAGVLYSSACWEALAGNTEAAIARLQAAIELDPRAEKWAEGDADLDAIRGLPGSPLPAAGTRTSG
jgi:tetratricopeptide (TPR) repeat protein